MARATRMSGSRVAYPRGALALLEHAIPARSRPGETLRVVSALARAARTIASQRAEAGPVEIAILAMAALQA